VIEIGQVPELPYDAPTTIARALVTGGSLPTPRPIDMARADAAKAFPTIPPGGHPTAHYIDPVPWLCPNDLCPVLGESGLIYADEHHLSNHGAHYLAAPLQQALESTHQDR